MLSRIITSLNHGAFFGLGSVVAASVVPKEKQASAVATMFMGLTIANIGGCLPRPGWVKPSAGGMSFWPPQGWSDRHVGAVVLVAEGSAGAPGCEARTVIGTPAGAVRLC